MNYFDHHIGDYAEATSHLTFTEDAAYHRCIRKYYAREKPLPADPKEVQRLVGARTKEEKNAVTAVLSEFFFLTGDGWRNSRCDEDIEKYLAGEPEREAKKANEETRLKRHREDRAALFLTLSNAGKHAPWNIGMKELRAMVAELPATAAETKTATPATLPATAPATLATATQAPNTRHQSPEYKDMSEPPVPDVSATPEQTEKRQKRRPNEDDYKTARWMYGALLKVNASARQPNFDTWADEVRLLREIDKRTHRDICELFQFAKNDSFWSPNIQSPSKLRAKWDVLTELRAKPAKQAASAWWTSDASKLAKGEEMGMRPLPGESMFAFEGRIRSAIENGGKPPAAQSTSNITTPAAPEPKSVKPAGLDLKALVGRSAPERQS